MIRKATLDDVEAVSDICRCCFPGSLLWAGPRFLSNNWWKVVIKSSSAETWVCLNNGEIGSLGVFVTDMAGWKREKLYPERNLFIRLFALAICPRVVFSKLLKIITSPRVRVTNCPTKKIAEADIESQIWLRLVVVSPRMRRQGLAKKIIHLCEERALQLHRQAVGLFVFSDNNPARSLFAQLGFVCTEHRHNGCVYTKVLAD